MYLFTPASPSFNLQVPSFHWVGLVISQYHISPTDFSLLQKLPFPLSRLDALQNALPYLSHVRKEPSCLVRSFVILCYHVTMSSRRSPMQQDVSSYKDTPLPPTHSTLYAEQQSKNWQRRVNFKHNRLWIEVYRRESLEAKRSWVNCELGLLAWTEGERAFFSLSPRPACFYLSFSSRARIRPILWITHYASTLAHGHVFLSSSQSQSHGENLLYASSGQKKIDYNMYIRYYVCKEEVMKRIFVQQ